MGERNPIASLNFDDNVSVNWTKWRKRFENYMLASELIKKPEETQCATLHHYITASLSLSLNISNI